MSNSGGFDSHPHVALIPSAGMGHLTPFLRLAASLVQHHHCRVTLITTHPTVSLAESQHVSNFLSAFPQVIEKQFHLLPFDPNSANSTDPFCLQWEAIRRSAQLLNPLLSSTSPPLSALITDVTLISSVLPVTITLDLPNYILFTSSARMCSLVESLPAIVASKLTTSGSVHFDGDLEIPGLPPIPLSSVPPAVIDSKSLFAIIFLENGKSFIKSNGVLINTFEALEADTLDVLNGRSFIDGAPPLYPIGPLLPCKFEKRDSSAPLKWLDDQPEGSVVYVSFGSRLALSMEQTKELGNGLLRSGCRFLWVVKGKIVDKEDEESLENVLGHELIEKIKDQGFVVKNWVDQEEILAHKAIGGFVCHGGWNSLVEAAWHGVRVLVWPQFGDQKINAEAVEKAGLGMWVRSWGWGAQVLVKGDEIGEKIKDMMENKLLREQAAGIGEEARKAVGVGGSSERTFMGLIEKWKNTQ